VARNPIGIHRISRPGLSHVGMSLRRINGENRGERYGSATTYCGPKSGPQKTPLNVRYVAQIVKTVPCRIG
jgi:hypothetical protein